MLIDDIRNGGAELKKIGRMTESSLFWVIMVEESSCGD